jgi:hypothetical protein
VRASPDEIDAMAAFTRRVSWGYGDGGGDGDLEVCVVSAGGRTCVEEASSGEDGGSDCEVALPSSPAGGAARATALSTISSTSASVRRSRTCTL